jgi:hypothetical protein
MDTYGHYPQTKFIILKKNGGHNLRGTMLLETFCFFFVPQMGLTGTTYYPFKLQQGKTRENEGCHYIQMGPHKSHHMPQLWSLRIGPK